MSSGAAMLAALRTAKMIDTVPKSVSELSIKKGPAMFG